jgi:hypothetical protein
MHTLTLVGDPNDGTHGLYMNGVLICDSGDDDVTFNHVGMDFWRDALDAAITHLGGELVEETRYRPSLKDTSYDQVDEWVSFWPEKLEDMGPVEPPYEPAEEEDGEPANPDWIF